MCSAHHPSEELWFKWERENIAARVPVTAKALNDIKVERGLVLEGLVGTSAEFLPFRFLEQGCRRGRSICRIEVRKDSPEGIETLGYGTGSLIAPFLLMTNNHVLPSVESCKRSVAQFKYEIDLTGADIPADEWALAPERMFITNPFDRLDFTIVGIVPRETTEAGSLYGTTPLRASRSKISVGEPANIIQHPKGQRKEVVLQENIVTGFFEGGYVQYTSDTLVGSSGAPVFNNSWDLIALHHRGVLRRDQHGEPIYQNGDYLYEANEGIRISEIISYLQSGAILSEQRLTLQPYLYP